MKTLQLTLWEKIIRFIAGGYRPTVVKCTCPTCDGRGYIYK